MDVQGLRNYVRAQLEVDDEELPDTLLNIYLQEAFDRTMAATNRWPRNEFVWPVSKIAGQNFITLPPDLNLPSIISIVSVADGYPLVIIPFEQGEQSFAPVRYEEVTSGVNKPLYASVWSGKLYLWPQLATDATYDVVLRGHRQPVWTNGASDLPDLDERLHVTLSYYAMALAYAAQEDEILEGVYMARWDRDLQNQLRAIQEPIHNHPLVMHGGAPVGGVPAYVINPPPFTPWP